MKGKGFLRLGIWDLIDFRSETEDKNQGTEVERPDDARADWVIKKSCYRRCAYHVCEKDEHLLMS